MPEDPTPFLQPQITILTCYQGVKTSTQTQWFPIKTPTHIYFEKNLLALK